MPHQGAARDAASVYDYDILCYSYSGSAHFNIALYIRLHLYNVTRFLPRHHRMTSHETAPTSFPPVTVNSDKRPIPSYLKYTMARSGLEKLRFLFFRFLGFKRFQRFFFYKDRCRQTRKSDPKASEICIP